MTRLVLGGLVLAILFLDAGFGCSDPNPPPSPPQDAAETDGSP